MQEDNFHLYPDNWDHVVVLFKTQNWQPLLRRKDKDEANRSANRQNFLDEGSRIYYAFDAHTTEIDHTPFSLDTWTHNTQHLNDRVLQDATKEINCYRYAPLIGLKTPKHFNVAISPVTYEQRNKILHLSKAWCVSVSEIPGKDINEILHDTTISETKRNNVNKEAVSQLLIASVAFGDADRNLSNVKVVDFQMENPQDYYHFDFEAADILEHDLAIDRFLGSDMAGFIEWDDIYERMRMAYERLKENKADIAPDYRDKLANNLRKGMTYIGTFSPIFAG